VLTKVGATPSGKAASPLRAAYRAVGATVAGRPVSARTCCGEGGATGSWRGDPRAADRLSKIMNWALSLPGACLAEVQSEPGRPMLTQEPPLTGSISWSL
jgi:hypothetical protein